ncbi:sensor histidine kinase [Chitinophaga cymbidii]|uniref:histidine kinase n=2 Tax=Chitinophaga cymbidii TaxID=1096750 RepID=A0A512RHC2_9BACT|nr:hypothetical protein CCY01nite_13560 [Chitinophaga cymbidii]
MCTCILGIFAFQGYWLYNSYELKLEDFHKDINDALRVAVFNKQFADARRFIGYSQPAMTARGISEPGRTAFYVESHTIIDTTPRRTEKVRRNVGGRFGLMRALPADTGIHVDSSFFENGAVHIREWSRADTVTRIYADSIAEKISNMIILNRFYDGRLSIKKLDSTYTAELASRGITTDFRLDTMKISDHEGFGQPRIRQLDPLKTFRIPFNPLSDIFVQASFSSPMRLILGQMTGTLLSSAVLLILTVLCFLYMLRTILRQKKLSEVRNDFINNMTHELKTPIATVSAAVEAMQNFNALNDRQKTDQYLNISQQELQRLSDLVEKVLHIAAEEKEDLELFREPVDLNELIRNIIANHRLKANKKVDFTYTMLADPMVNVDKTHLSNALNNLVDNAVKYSGDTAEITIRVSRQHDRLQVTVTDNGIGIPHNYLDSIFEKFFRVPTGDLHNVKGFGLGLSYVKKVVEKHGGSIRVKSEPEKGTEFLLEIPEV